MLRVSIAPIIRSTSNCNCSFCYRSYCQINNLLPTWPNKDLLGHAGGRLFIWQYDLYQKLQLQFDVLLMMGVIDTQNMQSNFAVNKRLHAVVSRWILLIWSQNAWNHEYNIHDILQFPHPFWNSCQNTVISFHVLYSSPLKIIPWFNNIQSEQMTVSLIKIIKHDQEKYFNCYVHRPCLSPSSQTKTSC